MTIKSIRYKFKQNYEERVILRLVPFEIKNFSIILKSKIILDLSEFTTN